MEKEKENIQEEIIENNDSENFNENPDENPIEKHEEKLHEETNEDNEEGLEEETEEDRLRNEIFVLKEEKIRVLAEMENLRKRFEREKVDSIKYASVNFARDILSPGDNLERALSAINKDEDHPEYIKNLIEGLIMVRKELSNALEKNGITKINTLNKKFDPNQHQAMMEVENDDLEEGMVVQEIQSGYTMHDRLLRPAMVGVSKKSQQETNIESDTDPKPLNLDIEKDAKK